MLVVNTPSMMVSMVSSTRTPHMVTRLARIRWGRGEVVKTVGPVNLYGLEGHCTTGDLKYLWFSVIIVNSLFPSYLCGIFGHPAHLLL